jgi:hypothetical protein
VETSHGTPSPSRFLSAELTLQRLIDRERHVYAFHSERHRDHRIGSARIHERHIPGFVRRCRSNPMVVRGYGLNRVGMRDPRRIKRIRFRVRFAAA